MKRLLLVAVIASGTFPAVLYADEPKTFHGVIHFVGSIVRGPCDMTPTEWHQHAGRTKGRNPSQAGALPASSNECAGIADTYSIRTEKVLGAGNTVQGEYVIVTFN